MPTSTRLSRRRFLAGALAATGAGAAAAIVDGPFWWDQTPDETGSATLVDDSTGTWSDPISLRNLAPIHASLLLTGEVLISGVDHEAGRFPDALIDLSSSTTDLVRAMPVPMRSRQDSLICAGHAHLADGRMLQVGGQHHSPEVGLTYGLVFDARVGGSLGWRRIDHDLDGGPAWYPTVTRLADKRALVISGFVDFGSIENRTIQVFDVADHDMGRNPWTQLVSHDEVPDVSPTGADYTHVFVLQRPIQALGRPRQVAMFGRTGQIHLFDHSGSARRGADRFMAPNNGRRPTRGGQATAAGASSVMLSDGRILIAGGGEEGGEGASSWVDIYDPVTDRWRSIETGIPRSHPAAVLLPDGTVLIVNGDGGRPGQVSRPQIVDPLLETVATGPPAPDREPRGYHNVALLLTDGRVLTGGGELHGEETERSSVRVFAPPYLSVRAPERPEIVQASPLMRYGSRYPVRVKEGPIHRITLLALGSMTHSFDQNQRIVALFDGEEVGKEVLVGAPSDPASAPPGYYILFVLRRMMLTKIAGLAPSVGRVIRLG